MIDLDFLRQPLGPPKVVGTNSIDADLDQILSLAERNQFVPAGEIAEKLWRDGVYDARTLGVLLYAVLDQQGMGALERVFEATLHVLEVQFSLVGPAHNKLRHLDGALRFFATTLQSQFRFAKKLNPKAWQTLLGDWEKANQASALGKLAEVIAHMEHTFSGTPTYLARTAFLQLQKSLHDLPTTRKESPKKESAKMDGNANGSEISPIDRSSHECLEIHDTQGVFPTSETQHMKPQDPNAETGNASGGATGKTGPIAVVSGVSGQPTLVITLSPLMHALIKKIGAFNRLVRLGRFKHAAIIYKDIAETIEKFDPRLFLPSIFGDYFSNIVAHADKLLPSLDVKDDFALRALMDLYRIDLELFIQATT